uniref:FtsK domain-containing protein n=1 Tax=Branchiostoma floridae TaxID=7739 RepID=C3YVV7_BRAFL|eukprot:XP_002599629.1 hypothetical protein BRAFLDRAFT_102573 [Branchiostoma floridae]
MAQYEPIPVSSLRDQVKQRLTGMPKKEFNVLVVGVPGSGKSSFVNSMIMAVTGTWHEVAHYSERFSGRATHSLERYVMFDDNCKEVHEPHPIPDYKQNVIFWDCAGFPNANDEAYSTIVSLTLDGCMPTDVPIVLVVTKIDKCPEQDLQQRIEEAKGATDLKGNRVRFKKTSLYCEELTSFPDPNDYRVMMPNEEIDRNLLNIWMSLTDRNIKAKPAENESCCVL